jgi:hypothetical protein
VGRGLLRMWGRFPGRRISFLPFALMLLVTSCVTPGRPKVLLDGVEAERVHHDIWRIFVKGHDFPSEVAANDYAILQIAQTTIAHGGTHFIVLSPPGLLPVSTVDPGANYTMLGPGRETVIRIIIAPRGRHVRRDAFSAEAVLRSIRGRLLAVNWCGC